jgi:hypothetical protein
MFHRPWRQAESLRIPLHLTLDTYHCPSSFQPTDAHTALDISSKHLVLQMCDRVLEAPMLTFKASVAVNLRYQ